MIPQYLEQLVHQGKAEFKSYSGFACENHIITVPASTYIIIYEYWYKPQLEIDAQNGGPEDPSIIDFDYRNLVSYVHFYTGNKYHPFFHKPQLIASTLNAAGTISPVTANNTIKLSGINTDYRSCYIGSSKDVSVYFTRLIDANVTYTPLFPPPVNQFIAGLGYANLSVAGKIQRFNLGNNTHYGPLQQPISEIAGFTSIEYNQAFTTPQNGSIKPPETIIGQNAEKSNRQLFFHCNYVQVNEPAPKTLI